VDECRGNRAHIKLQYTENLKKSQDKLSGVKARAGTRKGEILAEKRRLRDPRWIGGRHLRGRGETERNIVNVTKRNLKFQGSKAG